MSETAPKGIYVYQPDPPRKDGRMFGLGGLPLTANLKGLTRDEAAAFADALNEITWIADRCTTCGHVFALASSACPQCSAPASAPWVEWSDTCECKRCAARRRHD
jgi:rubredoxin